MDARHTRGRAAEQQACDYLLSRGLKLLARNVRGRGGEIDLVMQDGNSLVFVEVRYRRSKRYGSAAESVNSIKQQRLVSVAQQYLQVNDPAGHLACRFDVIALHGESIADIEWIRNAIEV